MVAYTYCSKQGCSSLPAFLTHAWVFSLYGPSVRPSMAHCLSGPLDITWVSMSCSQLNLKTDWVNEWMDGVRGEMQLEANIMCRGLTSISTASNKQPVLANSIFKSITRHRFSPCPKTYLSKRERFLETNHNIGVGSPFQFYFIYFYFCFLIYFLMNKTTKHSTQG